MEIQIQKKCTTETPEVLYHHQGIVAHFYGPDDFRIENIVSTIKTESTSASGMKISDDLL